ncbi:hypothetical protein EON83_03165 [bacterium]|nr:MAG: hypothetical protein EON83_03165 [bacterium]
MNADDFGVLANAVLQDARLCLHLREASSEDEFWQRLEVLARELNVAPDFEALRGVARGAFSFWLSHWSGGGVG